MIEVKTVLLTGISGFIAKRIALDLICGGYFVVGSLRSKDRETEVRTSLKEKLPKSIDIDAKLRFVKLDLTNDQGWVEVLSLIHI